MSISVHAHLIYGIDIDESDIFRKETTQETFLCDHDVSKDANFCLGGCRRRHNHVFSGFY